MKKNSKKLKNYFTFKNHWVKRAAIVMTLAFVLTGGYFGYSWVADYIELHTPLEQAPTEIKGKIVTLKRLKEEYFVDFHNMYSKTVRKALEFSETVSLGYIIDYLHGEMERDRKGEQLMYCIFDNKENKLVGSLEIREKNDIDPGQFGCWLNENYWGGGRMQEAIKLITNVYFRLKPQEKSFTAHVRVWNKRSYFALKKAGFKEMGFFYENGRATRYILEMTRP